jgi:hypothetical protein
MIISFFVLLLLFVIVLIFKNNEYFQNEDDFEGHKYLNIEDASHVLRSVEEFNNYNDMDFKVRKIEKDKYENICDFYIESLENYTSHEKVILDWVMKVLNDKTPDNLKFLYNNICFAKYKSNIEQNFPHTHKNTIFLSKKFLNRCIFFYNKNLEEDMIENFGVIIIHECVHLWQRKNKELFEKLYVYYWNFVRVNKIENNHLMKYYRFNPDGTDVNWVLNNKKNDKHILLMSLYSEDAKNLGHVDNVGVYLDKYELTFIMPDEENLKKENLNECNIFNELFENITSNNYHPNELSAELISIYYLQKMEISHYNFDNKALQKLENWFNKEVLK